VRAEAHGQLRDPAIRQKVVPVKTLLLTIAALVAAAAPVAPVAPVAPAVPVGPVVAVVQSDLDAFMSRVLTRRDENWKKLQQYILEEQERLQITGPDGVRIYGFNREYTWFIREGYFVRSPLKFDGVTIGESERRQAERRWIEREQSREKRREERARRDPDAANSSGGEVAVTPQGVQVDIVSGGLEPRFVSAAYFLRFKFDPGHYALAGREAWNGRDVLKIEYYPSKLFTEGRTRPNERVRDRDDEVEQKMNKVSLVTLWIDPKEHQILQYTFDNVGLEFLPGRSIVRVDEMMASMKMTQPFPDVWLPATIEMGFGLSTALGSLQARYNVTYHDYRLAEVTSKIRPPQ
jgi:hypothetical protein